MLKIFAEKNVSSFCSAKATHIFSAKNIRILCIESVKTVNEMTLNELVKLTTFLNNWAQSSIKYKHLKEFDLSFPSYCIFINKIVLHHG